MKLIWLARKWDGRLHATFDGCTLSLTPEDLQQVAQETDIFIFWRRGGRALGLVHHGPNGWYGDGLCSHKLACQLQLQLGHRSK